MAVVAEVVVAVAEVVVVVEELIEVGHLPAPVLGRAQHLARPPPASPRVAVF